METSSRTPSPKRGLVYIHGAGLGEWIWDEVTQALDVPQLTASFPGRDGDPAALEDLGLGAYVNHVRRQIEGWPVQEVILVSHSIGGVVGLEVAEALEDRIVGFVGICAAIPEPGGSFLSCYPIHQRIVQRLILRFVGTKPPDSAIRGSLGSGLSEEQVDRLVEQFTPESRRLYTDRSIAESPDVPALYVETANDAEFSPSMQEQMSANLDADEVVVFDAGHMPMLSQPRELAAILDRFVRNIECNSG